MRDTLIDLFDREFIESQEALGMNVMGQFRDLDDANRFVWFRGFPDMFSRAQALKSFYTGPVWKAHREAANSTMVDSDNVLLLRPAHPKSGFLLGKRPPPGAANEIPKSIVVGTICYFDALVGDRFVKWFENVVMPHLSHHGVSLLAYFVTESSTNNYPALPVREGENVFLWFSLFRDQKTYEDRMTALARSPQWREVSQELSRRLKREPEVLKLSPTSRSQIGTRIRTI